MEYPEGYGFAYIALLRKADEKEVYSSPAKMNEDHSEPIDYRAVKKNLNFYFDRVNSGIQQQLESPRLSDEQKKALKLLEKKDYEIICKKCVPMGWRQEFLWKKEAEDFLKGQQAV